MSRRRGAAEEKVGVDAATELIAASVDAIIYGRGLLPDDFFEWRAVLGEAMPLPRLLADGDPKKRDTVATVQGWNGGLRESIKKRYLKSAALVVVDDVDQAVERYVFKLSYEDTAVVETEIWTKSHTRAELVRVIGKIHYLNSALPPLSGAASRFTMKLAYTSNAPPRYSPPHFELCGENEYSFGKMQGYECSQTLAAEVALTVAGARLGDSECTIKYKGPAPEDVEFAGDSAETNSAARCYDVEREASPAPPKPKRKRRQETVDDSEVTRLETADEGLYSPPYDASKRGVRAVTFSKKQPKKQRRRPADFDDEDDLESENPSEQRGPLSFVSSKSDSGEFRYKSVKEPLGLVRTNIPAEKKQQKKKAPAPPKKKPPAFTAAPPAAAKKKKANTYGSSKPGFNRSSFIYC